MNRNVVINIVLSGVTGSSESIWQQTLFVAWLDELTSGSNTKVGLCAAAQGLASMLSAFPAGWAADRYSRSLICFIGGIVMLCALGLAGFGVRWSGDSHVVFLLMCAALGLYGVAQGIANGPAQALMADSLPTGNRDKYYNYLYVTSLLGSTAGPALSIVLFTMWNGYSNDSDEWPVDDLKTVLLIGMLIGIPAALLMLCFRDDKALGDESEAVGSPRGGGGADDANLLQADTAEAEWMEQASQMSGFGGRITVKHVPYIVFTSDLVIAAASGMTIKFFPLFFKNDCQMSPAQVQTIYLFVPLAIASLSSIGTRCAGVLGRIQTVLLLRFIGLANLLAIIILYHFNVNKWLIVAVYVIRTAFMNCTYPLEEGIIMDYVPKAQRARWKALESVAMFGWCGSAALGGILADRYDYTTTFAITLVMQLLATTMYGSLITVVIKTRPCDFKSVTAKHEVSDIKREEQENEQDQERVHEETQKRSSSVVAPSDSGQVLAQPLLSHAHQSVNKEEDKNI